MSTRLIYTAIAVFHFECSEFGSQCEQLMSKTDAEDGFGAR